MSDGTTIDISIYQSPDIKLPVAFSFPDKTGQLGNALLLLPIGLPEELTGKVTFWSVEEGSAVEGEFDFVTGTGQQFKGEFVAEWKNEIIYCG